MANNKTIKLQDEIIALLKQMDKEFVMHTPFDPLYVAGIKRALHWVLNDRNSPIEISDNKDSVCSKCGTDLLVPIDKTDERICINCKNYQIKR